MTESNASRGTCQSCGGRGWKYERPMRAVVTDRLGSEKAATWAKRPCAVCDGTGSATDAR